MKPKVYFVVAQNVLYLLEEGRWSIYYDSLLLFGSKKIPEFARGIGKGMREFRKATDDIKKEINEDTNDIKKDIKDIKDNITGD